MDLQLPTAVSAAAALATLAQLAGTREMTRSMPKQACTGVWWKRIECVGGGSWCFQKQNQGRDKRRVMNLPAGRRSTPDAVSVHELCADAARQGAPQQPKKRGGARRLDQTGFVPAPRPNVSRWAVWRGGCAQGHSGHPLPGHLSKENSILAGHVAVTVGDDRCDFSLSGVGLFDSVTIVACNTWSTSSGSSYVGGPRGQWLCLTRLNRTKQGA